MDRDVKLSANNPFLLMQKNFAPEFYMKIRG